VILLGRSIWALIHVFFPEMSPPQVKYYALLLKRLLVGAGGLVFDENDAVLKPHHTRSQSDFAEVFPLSNEGFLRRRRDEGTGAGCFGARVT